MDDDITLNVNGQDVSLAQLAGIDMSDVAEQRFTVTPEGVYQFQVENCSFEQRGEIVGIMVDCKIHHADNLVNANAADWIGKNHAEFFMIGEDPVKSLGYFKAFVSDIGVSGDAVLEQLMQQLVGHMFIAKVVHRKDKNDKSKIYCNISQKKEERGPLAPHAATATAADNAATAAANAGAPTPQAEQPAAANPLAGLAG